MSPFTFTSLVLLHCLELLSWTPISQSTLLLTPPPLPLLPIPTAHQLQWQVASMAVFLHFGTNTFTNSEWGTGRADPRVFNPDQLDAAQWVRVVRDSGFKRVIITAKHHDGFCLWPSGYTDYSVKSSPWRGGGGDVVKELALAAKEAGLGLGVYLSPWDRHEPRYGRTVEYNEFYMAQMTELLTKYGEITDVFLDGAPGKGKTDMEYLFDEWFSLIHQHQPGAIIFSDAGPDTRWIGDEAGVAGSTCWSLYNRSNAEIGNTDPMYQRHGDPFGHDWVPGECDLSIRPGWFWHPSEVPKSALELLQIYYKSVGRNCHMLLNVPPNSSGLISSEDIEVLREFSELRRSIFSHNLASDATLSASSTRGGSGDSPFGPYNVVEDGIYSYWAPEENQSNKWVLQLKFHGPASFNVLQVQEPIHMGQRIIAFHVEILTPDGHWRTVANGTTVGYQRLLQFPSVDARQLKLVIDKARAVPLVSYLGVYMDRFSIVNSITDSNSSQVYHNRSQAINLQQATQNHSQTASM